MRIKLQLSIIAVCLALFFAVGYGPAHIKDALVGAWKTVKETHNDGVREVTYADGDKSGSWIFNADGNCAMRWPGKEKRGIWEIIHQDGRDLILISARPGKVTGAFLVRFGEGQDQVILTERDYDPPYEPRRTEKVFYLQRQ